jgi:mannuronan synthase
MSETSPNIVHEAEANRQHVRITLPAKVRIGNDVFDAADWSSGGISLEMPGNRDISDSIEKGRVLPAEVNFLFEGFEMAVPLNLEVVNIDRNRGRVGCKFHDLDRRQRNIIQYFVSAYMSGELVRVGDIMDVVARNNMTKARNIPDAKAGMTMAQIQKQKLDKTVRTALVTVISLALLAYIATSIYERFFIVKAHTARVVAEMLTVDTPSGGKIFYAALPADTAVKKGQPIFTVASDTGTVTSADSPCDCIIKNRLMDNNRIVKKGEPALELVRPDAKPFVEASISNEQAVKLEVGQETLLALPGHDTYIRGQVQSIQTVDSAHENSTVVITPVDPLPVEYVDDPVEVRIDTLDML